METKTVSKENKEREKQAFCPSCGRSYQLENHGDNENPIWYFPRHIVKKIFSAGTKLCPNAGHLVN